MRFEVKAVGIAIALLVVFSIFQSLGSVNTATETPRPKYSETLRPPSQIRAESEEAKPVASSPEPTEPQREVNQPPGAEPVVAEPEPGQPIIETGATGKKAPGVLPFGNAASPKFLGVDTSSTGTGTAAQGKNPVGFTCPKLQDFHLDHFGAVLAKIDFKGGPKYNMPWYYDDPHPLCGRYMLEFIGQFGTGASKPPSTDSGAGAAVALNGIPAGGGFVTSSSTRAAWLLHRLKLPASVIRFNAYNSDTHTLTLTQGADPVPLELEQCGRCSTAKNGANCTNDVLITARLVGADGFASVPVIKNNAGRSTVHVSSLEPGKYQLEVKLVHWDGLSDNPKKPKSLGVIGIRTFENKRKSYRYNNLCDQQRHVYGSPINIEVRGNSAPKQPTDGAESEPFCTAADHTEGRWIRWTKPGYQCSGRQQSNSSSLVKSGSGKYCEGDPSWMSDACAFNKEMLWAPKGCRYRFYSPPQGPTKRCIKAPGRGFLMMVGDSVTREYGMNCKLFDLSGSGLTCIFNNIALEGKHYSTAYALDVAKVIVNNIKTTNPSVFATNLGIHHMIGPCTTAQWSEFVDLFVQEYKKSIKMAELEYLGGEAVSSKFKWKLKGSSRVEKLVWLGPPTIQYARLGMGAQRAARWDAIAWSKLEPLGFQRVYAIAPTASRQEGTWDGLHYAAAKGKLQSPWVNKQAKVLAWNGGVANMLFTMMLNLVCNSEQ